MNSNKKTKLYRDVNGDVRKFDVDRFRSSIKSNGRAKKLTIEEYERELAAELSCSYDTIEGWKKGKNAPQDIETVLKLEEAMNLTKYSLLFSENEHLRNENLLYKQKIETLEQKLQNSERLSENKQNNFVFAERLSPFCLRYNGFSNLIDILIGYYWGREDDCVSTYAEELSYIIGDYVDSFEFSEILGYQGKRSREEVREYLDNNMDKRDDDEFIRWLYEVIVDSKGNKLYDENNKLTIHGIQLWQKLRDSSVLSPSDKGRVSALLDELIREWDKFQEPYATCSIKIQYEDVVIYKYHLGMGFTKPSHDDRMDVITELLFLTNGRVEPYTLENAIKFHSDQFEMELEIVFDISRF